VTIAARNTNTIPAKKWLSVLVGSLTLKSKHRLLCGDSTVATSVAYLLDGAKADMVFTDPPYGMNAVSKSGVLSKNYSGDIAGDDNTDAAKDSFQELQPIIGDSLQVWWGANYYSSILPDSECWLVWDKNNGGSDQTDCELAWTNMRSVVRQYTQASEKIGRVHPTQKPVSLVEWVFDNFHADPKAILDPFLGSGTTLIAAEKTGRKSYGLEIDPIYCDVAVRRWENYTGERAVRIGQS
jgi:DNA modification methylase